LTKHSFQLQKVLDTRERQQKGLQLALSTNRKKQKLTTDEIEETVSSQTKLYHDLNDVLKRGAISTQLNLFIEYSQKLFHELNEQKEQLNELKSEENELTSNLEQTAKEKKILENLKQHALQMELFLAEKEEQKRIDEMILTKVATNMI
jgi:flagellar export protein FliJ